MFSAKNPHALLLLFFVLCCWLFVASFVYLISFVVSVKGPRQSHMQLDVHLAQKRCV